MSARAGWLPHAADKLALFGAPFLCLMCSFTWWFVRIRPEHEPKSLVSRKMSQRLHVRWRADIFLSNDVRRLTENVFWGLKFDGRKESQSTGIDLLCFCVRSDLWGLSSMTLGCLMTASSERHFNRILLKMHGKVSVFYFARSWANNPKACPLTLVDVQVRMLGSLDTFALTKERKNWN